MKIHEVKGGGGLRLHVREWGRPDGGSILFLHGWSQNYMCWRKQYLSSLADEFRLVALDLRGHGMSDAPLTPEHYTNAQLWADDTAAVIDQLGLNGAVLVGWSYGGFMICDYLRLYEQHRIAGINFVSGAVILNNAAFGTLIGPGFTDPFAGATADDLPTNIHAMRTFVRGCVARPLSVDDYEDALCWNMAVPAKIRAALAMRDINGDDALTRLNVPVLVTQGKADTVVLPAMAEHILSVCPAATASWYEGVGHVAHMEEPGRFNRELADFARQAQGKARIQFTA
jgi:non-heme chloroperoxidase